MKNTKYTYDYIKNKVNTYRDGEFELKSVEQFNGCKSTVTVLHKKCGRELTNQNIANFIGLDRGCKFCDSNKLDSKKIIKMINSVDEYKCVSENINSIRDKVNIKHNICGNIFSMRPADFIYNKHRCSICNTKEMYTEKIIRSKISDIAKDYEFIRIEPNQSGIKPSRQKIRVKHNTCGTETVCSVHNFIINGQRCKECSKNKLKFIGSSKQYLLIKDFLDKNSIKYETEKTFDGLRYKRPLRVDFLVNIDDKQIVIEYDGKQHFVTNKHNKVFTKEKIEIIKFRDKLKDDFFANHNIKVVRFNYMQTDNEILDNLNKLLILKIL